MLKFSQKDVTTKNFHRQRQINDLLTIDVNKVVVSDKVPCNNGKDYRYIIGYQVDEALVTLFIKTAREIFSYGVSQYDKNFAYSMPFNVSEKKVWKARYKKIWNEIKKEGTYVNGKLKTWNKRIKTNFQGQAVPYNIHCNATAVLKIDSVYK